MTDANQALPGPMPPPSRAGHGCLWGCLIAAVIAVAAILGAISYGGWWLYSGFKNDPTLHVVMETLNANQIARSVLGDDIAIVDLESSNFSTDTTNGTHASYVAHLRGSKGNGLLAVTVDTGARNSRITSMVLTGPDGRTYDLATPLPTVPPGSI